MAVVEHWSEEFRTGSDTMRRGARSMPGCATVEVRPYSSADVPPPLELSPIRSAPEWIERRPSAHRQSASQNTAGQDGIAFEHARDSRRTPRWLEGTVMRTSLVAGVVLIVVGVLILAYGGFSFTRREKVLDIGPIQATAERHERVPLPPILGGAALLGGIGLLVAAGPRPAYIVPEEDPRPSVGPARRGLP